ncbi:MAG: hypothetical protein CL878_06560 [Dehalococcoidia bacterium]|nr:hypothetical protein [Dehalococcoidia bacterium]
MDLATRRATRRHVSSDDLLAGFRRVGIHPGDTVYCHSSLSKFGYVEGGTETVIEALLMVVGPRGTLAAPAGTYSLKNVPRPVFDVRNTPSELGTISEAIRRRSTHRSHHLLESVSALGLRAAELTATHSVTNCGRESPFQKLIAWDAQILLLGVSHNANTTVEAVEEELGLEYVAFTEIAGARIVDEEGRCRPLPTLLTSPTCPYDFNRLNRPLIKAGAQSAIVIGEAIVRRVSAAGLARVVRRMITADTYALRLPHARRVPKAKRHLPALPTSIHDL